MSATSKDSSADDDGIPEEKDWRAFRAMLIQQESSLSSSAPAQQTTSLEDDGAAADMTRWAYDAGMNIEVGTVLLSIPTTDLCQALEQQYFHRCVVLVTHCNNENGIRGILLNRPTAFMYKAADDDYEWSLWFGGDMYENHIDDDEEIMCVHSLTSRQARDVSEPIERGLSHTTLVHARALVKESIASPSDFWCFGGHCKWFPGQLEQEMGPERGEWFAASLDATSILNEVRQQAQAGATAGLDMWQVLVDRIEKENEATSHIPSGQLRFYDRMLQAWVNTNLVLTADESSDANITSSSVNLGPGTVVRATMKAKGSACPPFLLSEQDFHRSLIIVLSDNDTSTVGVHLNLPLSGVVEVSEKITPPIRYGGPIGSGETSDEDESFVWIHRSPALQRVGGGTKLGKSGFWSIKEDDAVGALQSGGLSPEDVMVFSGLCVWEKGADLGCMGGGLREQVEAMETMEVVSPNKADKIWNVLNKQEVLTSETLESNLDIAIAAWEAAGDKDDPMDENTVGNDDVILADTALRAWAAVSLLDEPTTTLIEVPEG